MKHLLAAISVMALFACDNSAITNAQDSKNTPIGMWEFSEKGTLDGYQDSITIKRTISLGADSIGTWKMYINEKLNKAFQGKWKIQQDTISILVSKCSDAESMQPVDCNLFYTTVNYVPGVSDLRFYWNGNSIELLYIKGFEYVRIK